MKAVRFFRMPGWRLLVGWLVLFAALMGLTLDNTKPFKGDESFYITSAIEMVRSGNYLEPVYFGDLRFQKPILPYWFTVLGYLVFGISLWSGRLPFLALSVLLLALVYIFVRHVLHDETYAFLAVTMLSSSLLFLGFARHAMSDLPFTFFITLSLFSLYLALERERTRKWWYAAGWAAAALACLSKFLLGAAPLAALILWLVISRPRSWQRQLGGLLHPWNLLLFAAILLPWYLFAATRHTDVFLAQSDTESTAFLVGPLRMISNAVYYLLVLARFYAPFTIAALWAGWKRRTHFTPHLRMFAWFCALVFMVFVLLIDRQRERYLLIMFPALTVLMAVVFHQARLYRPLVRIAVLLFVVEAAGFIAYPAIAGEQVKELALRWRSECQGRLSLSSLERRKMSWVQALTNGEALIDGTDAQFIITGEEGRAGCPECRIVHQNEHVSRVRLSGMRVEVEKQRYYLLELPPGGNGGIVDEGVPSPENGFDFIGTMGR